MPAGRGADLPSALNPFSEGAVESGESVIASTTP